MQRQHIKQQDSIVQLIDHAPPHLLLVMLCALVMVSLVTDHSRSRCFKPHFVPKFITVSFFYYNNILILFVEYMKDYSIT